MATRGRPKRVSKQQEQARVEERLARVSALYVGRMNQYEIAKVVGVHQTQVFKDIKVLQERWRKSRGGFDEAKEKELAKLDVMEREAREMWELSKSEEAKQVDEETAERRVGMKPKQGEDDTRPTELKVVNRKTKTTHNSQTGSVYWWEQQRWCVEQRCKLLGLYAEERGKGGNTTVVQINWNDLVGRDPNATDPVTELIEGKLKELPPSTNNGEG